MGGHAFISSIICTGNAAVVYLYITDKSSLALSLLLSLAYALSNGLIGIFDDLTKLKKRENAGLSYKQKLVLQFLTSIAFVAARGFLFDNPCTVSFSFGSYDLGFIYYPMTVFILVGITNCANVTDGIDGLASGVAFAASVSLFYIACALAEDVAFISAAIIGATCAFLIFNIHPARIFMGDTGSLFLGALLSTAAVALANPLVIVVIGGVYTLEGISVLLQIAWFKLTGKRIFKMAPLHHHMEKLGWSENRICIVAIILTFLFSLPAFVLYLP
jgi:phospho-N-acetylmuramoyl-pentapeptide-transferase